MMNTDLFQRMELCVQERVNVFVESVNVALNTG